MKKRAVTISLAAIGVLLLVIGFVSWYAQHKLASAYGSSTPKAEANAHILAKQIESFQEELQHGQIPGIREDFQSVGFPQRETELLRFRHWMQVYEISFGKTLTQSSDLQRMKLSKPEEQRAVAEVVGECEILESVSDSYLLNCDGWRPSQAQLRDTVNQFDTQTVKFYVLDGHVVLYAPPFVRNEPTAKP